jgi:tryptophan synthase alpha chain
MNTPASTLLPAASKLPVMAHLVLGYPSLAESLHTAEAYINAGIEILEVQIPFSHPTADGPVITAACQEAVQQGVSVQDCIEAIRNLRVRFPMQEIMVMSYVNRIYTYGFQRFVTEMHTVGVRHLIVPDLPVDLSSSLVAPNAIVKLVPVLAANTPDARLEKLLNMGFDFFYLMSDFKITGSGFSLHPRLKAIVATIKSRPLRPRIGIGFGISTPEQARLVLKEADIAIIGSALIQAQKAGKLEEYLESLQDVFQA